MKYRLGTLPMRQQIKQKLDKPSQTLASLKIDPLQFPKLLGKYFAFKISLYGEGKIFRKQHLLILAGVASAAPSQVSARDVAEAALKLSCKLITTFTPANSQMGKGQVL